MTNPSFKERLKEAEEIQKQWYDELIKTLQKLRQKAHTELARL